MHLPSAYPDNLLPPQPPHASTSDSPVLAAQPRRDEPENNLTFLPPFDVDRGVMSDNHQEKQQREQANS